MADDGLLNHSTPNLWQTIRMRQKIHGSLTDARQSGQGCQSCYSVNYVRIECGQCADGFRIRVRAVAPTRRSLLA